MKARKSKILPVREPSGRPSRASMDLGRECSPNQVKRLRDAAIRGMSDPEWATELGRLFLSAKIDAPLFEAGKRWALVVRRYHLAIASPLPDPPPISFEINGKSSPPDPDSREGLLIAAADNEAVSALREAHAVLIGAGKMAEMTVRSVCERDVSPVGAIGLEALDRGLSWLAKHFGLIERQRHS